MAKRTNKTSLAPVFDQSQIETINTQRRPLHQASPNRAHPVDFVQWIPIERVAPNDYNPNSVAPIELRLLYVSIKEDGYTQPVVVIFDSEQDKYVIVDGFHRYYVMKSNRDVYESCFGCLPCVVIDKPINNRMASTVRHNRARGKHSVSGMSSMVFKMLENGWADAEICNELGMEPEELVRLKHITGFSKLFADREYNQAWMTRRQIKIRLEHSRKNGESGLVKRLDKPKKRK